MALQGGDVPSRGENGPVPFGAHEMQTPLLTKSERVRCRGQRTLARLPPGIADIVSVGSKRKSEKECEGKKRPQVEPPGNNDGEHH